MSRTIGSSIRITSVASIFQILIYLVQTAILIRILDPSSFGTYAQILLVYGVSQVIVEQGVYAAYINDQESGPASLSLCLGFNAVCLVLLASTLWIGTEVGILTFLSEDLAAGLKVMIWVLLISIVASAYRSYCEKKLDFKTVALAETASPLFGFLTAITFAKLDYEFLSLVYGFMANNAASLACYIIMTRKDRVFGVFGSAAQLRRHLHYGVPVAGHRIQNQLITNCDVLIGSFFLSPQLLGLYMVPRNFILKMQLVMNPVFGRVFFPYVAAFQKDTPRVRQSFLTISWLSSVVNVSMSGLLIFYSDLFITLYLGPSWGDYGLLVSVLAAWALFRGYVSPMGSLLLATGQTKRQFLWALCVLVLTPLVLIPCVYEWGFMGLAFGMAGLAAFLIIPAWRFLVYPICDLSFWSYMNVVFSGSLIILSPMLIISVLSSELTSNILVRLTGAIISVVFFLLLLYLFRRDVFYKFFKLIKGDLNEL